MTNRRKLRLVCCANCGSEGPFHRRLMVTNLYEPQIPLNIVTCQNCGLCFINPQYSAQIYLEYYTNQYYNEIDPVALEAMRLRSLEGHKEYAFNFLRHVLSSFPANGKYLDAGAGLGVFLDLFKLARPDVPDEQIFALEPSDYASENLLRDFPRIQVVRQAIDDNVFEESTFDAILCAALLEHFTDPLKELLCINRMMRLNGQLIVMTPSLERNLMIRGPSSFFKFVHTFYYTSGSIGALLEKAGFYVKESRILTGTPTSTYWYPILLLAAEKVERRLVCDLERVRRVDDRDWIGVRDADKVFDGLRKSIRINERRRLANNARLIGRRAMESSWRFLRWVFGV